MKHAALPWKYVPGDDNLSETDKFTNEFGGYIVSADGYFVCLIWGDAPHYRGSGRLIVRAVNATCKKRKK